MKELKRDIYRAIFLLAVITVGFILFYKPSLKTTLTEQAADHERYYCHETGFLFHHLKHNGDSFYVDEPVINRENEPVLCQKDK
jgi:hypothetical protein